MPDDHQPPDTVSLERDHWPSTHARRRLRQSLRALTRHWDVLLAVALGGIVGGLGRYGLSVLLPTRAGHFPLGTFVVNASGSAVLGFALVVLTEYVAPSRYARPFLGTGVLGAYTTFSTYIIETNLLIRQGHVRIATAYLFGSLAAGLLAARGGIALGWLLARSGTV